MSHPYSSELENAQRSLSRARMLLADEIADYPTPISGCDAQFNHLLAERRRIGAALAALDGEVFIPTPRMPVRASGVESR